MNPTRAIRNGVWAALWLGVVAPAASGQTTATPEEPEAPQATVQPGDAPAAEAAGLPGVTIDAAAGQVDLDAKVVLREGDWLELIACSPGTKEHESILTVTAKPSHIHLALLTLGLEPGQPMRVEMGEDDFEVIPPAGPAVEAFVVIEEEGARREVPVGAWVIDRTTGETLGDSRFLFAGSVFVPYEGKQVYMADLNGTVLSLVNFRDDLLTRDTTLTNRSDGQIFAANTDAIPPVGTGVKLRLRPVVQAGPPEGQDGAPPPEQP